MDRDNKKDWSVLVISKFGEYKAVINVRSYRIKSPFLTESIFRPVFYVNERFGGFCDIYFMTICSIFNLKAS